MSASLRITSDLHGSRILSVENVLETGASLLKAKEYLESQGATVETPALFITPATPFLPTYYVK